MSRCFFCAVIVSFSIGFSLLHPLQVLAQGVVASNSGQMIGDQFAAQDLRQLRETYRQLLAQYRDDERLYRIAIEQNTKLKTLTSLEEAVRSTRKAMVSRSELERVSLTMTRLTLEQTPGIEVSVKAKQLNEVANLLDALKSFQLKTEASADRVALQNRVTEYVQLHQKVIDTVYQSLTYIAIGNMQAVFDKSQVIRDETKVFIQENEKNPLKLSEKQRGIEEINRAISETAEKLQKITLDAQTAQGEYSSGAYTGYVNRLNEVYAGISRTISLLREVVK